MIFFLVWILVSFIFIVNKWRFILQFYKVWQKKDLLSGNIEPSQCNICYICSLKHKYKRKFLLFEEIVWTLKGEFCWSSIRVLFLGTKINSIYNLNCGKDTNVIISAQFCWFIIHGSSGKVWNQTRTQDCYKVCFLVTT